jgi:hypothetical protein
MKKTALVALILFAGIQAIPYGRDHTNPPLRDEPRWDSARTRDLAKRACFDCHSNETVWPWYSNVAPVSWLVQRDVDEGRAELNFSEWSRPREEGYEPAESVAEGEMPPRLYSLLHAEARLDAAEREALIRGLQSFTSKGEGIYEQDHNNPRPGPWR